VSDFREGIKAQFIEIAAIARAAAEGEREVHHTWAKCISEWRGALRDALAVHNLQETERELRELRELRDQLNDALEGIRGGRAGYMEPPE